MMKRFFMLLLTRFGMTGLLFAGVLLGPPTAFGFKATYLGPHPGSVAIHKTGPMAKANTALLKAFGEFQAHQQTGLNTAFKPSNPRVRFARGKILIDAVAAGNAEILLQDLKGFGLQQGSRFDFIVSGWLPLGLLKQVVALESLRSVSASLQPQTHVGSVTSEGDAAMWADDARLAFGVDGTGITIGVLSDSYNQQGGAAAGVASGDLPSGVNVLDDGAACNGPCTDEGRGMMEIIHDVAPGAALAFHTAFNGVADFANGILELADAAGGAADVIVDDVLYFAEPMFQDGPIAQAVNQVVNDHGVAYFSAAGNAARNSYENPYVASGEELVVQVCFITCTEENRGVLHDFDPSAGGVDWLQSITVPEGATVIITFQWDAPFASVSPGMGSPNDLDIYLVDATGGVILAESITNNIAGGDPVEVLQFTNPGVSIFFPYGPEFNLMIAHFDGPLAGRMKYVHFGNMTVNDYPTHSGSLFGHANAARAEAVGAAYWGNTPKFGVNPPVLESFSSAGGTPILLGTHGLPLPAPEDRDQPRLVAPDGVNTTFFYSDTDGDGNPNFFGTSAAAPHAAAVAALMLDADPSLSPAGVYSVMESTALDMGSAGFDDDSGYGFLRADQAVQAVQGLAAPTADFSYIVTGLMVNFTDLSSDLDGSVVAWNWSFGDGNGSSAQHPSHPYMAGTYTVMLTVTDNDGATDTTSQDVTVIEANSPPVASFTYVCQGTTCNFDASGSTDDGSIVNYAWDFDDGNASATTGPELLHTYGSAGTYMITLTVTDDSGESDTATATLRVKRKGSSEGASGSGGDDGGSGSPPCKGQHKNDPGCP